MMPLGINRAFVECMLRITTQTRTDALSLRLEGSLKGPWVNELARSWSALAATTHGITIKIDLQWVSFVDPAGLDLLIRIQREGAVLEGATAFVTRSLEQQNRTIAKS